MTESRAPEGFVAITQLRRLGLNCGYCRGGQTARWKLQYESGRTRRVDHSRTKFVCCQHLPEGFDPVSTITSPINPED
jgi:hypothetical protein